jgi:UDP-glucose 4-epimerase
MPKDNVLVTGGAGYIGSHAAKLLHNNGYQPIVYDNLVYGHTEAVKWGPLIEGSTGDRERMDALFNQYHPVAVMHFAAYAYVGESVVSPEKYYRNNVADTINLLEVMLKHRVKKFIFSSSCATYGEPEKIPITEEEKLSPINPYGHTKLMVEQILDDYDKAHEFRSVCLRYFNAAGADPDSEIGEDHNPETHLIPLVLQTALGQREAVSVYGTDYPTEDGTCIRDYIHVTDLAQAHWNALEYLNQAKDKSLKLNLGNGKGYSVKEVISMVKEVTGRDLNIQYTARRKGDPPCLVGSSEKAKKILSWKPEYNSLENIVETAWKWHLLKSGE